MFWATIDRLADVAEPGQGIERRVGQVLGDDEHDQVGPERGLGGEPGLAGVADLFEAGGVEQSDVERAEFGVDGSRQFIEATSTVVPPTGPVSRVSCPDKALIRLDLPALISP